MQRYWHELNYPLLIALLLLSTFGMINLYSATLSVDAQVASFFRQQLIWCVLGVLVMLLVIYTDYRRFYELSSWFYYFSIFLMCLVVLFGKDIAGQRNWLVLGNLRLQPAEFAKLALIIQLAAVLAPLKFAPGDNRPWGLRDLLPAIAYIFLPLSLNLMVHDVGNSLFFIAIGASLILIRGVKPKVIVGFALLVCVASGFAYQFFLKDYQKSRITNFLSPEADPKGSGYHLVQSKIAIGSGGWLGKGYLHGSINKLKFLPERHTDFVFSVWAEEWGFLGSGLLIACYTLCSLLMLGAAARAKDNFGAMIILGTTMLFFWHVVINLGGVLGLLPLAGIPLPFFSYGGSSLMTMFLGMGLIVGIHMRRRVF